MTVQTTRLDAVNTILVKAGKQPISALSSGNADSVIAEKLLEDAIRNVQLVGYYFNTRKDVTLSPDANNQIILGEDVIRIDVKGFDCINVYTIRNHKLYNKESGATNDFEEDIVADITYYLQWDDIPEAAKRYITYKAATEFITGFISDPNRLRDIVAAEQMAFINMQREDLQTANSRIFGPQFSRIVDRGKPLDWVN